MILTDNSLIHTLQNSAIKWSTLCHIRMQILLEFFVNSVVKLANSAGKFCILEKELLLYHYLKRFIDTSNCDMKLEAKIIKMPQLAILANSATTSNQQT